MTTTVRLVVTTGAGLLARRDDAVLFASSTTWIQWGEVLEHFADAEHNEAAVDAFLGEVVGADFAVDPFALITWSSDPVAITFGDIELTSDLPALPMMSGRGSTTWVEHRLVVPEQGCRLRAGASVTGPGRLTGGIVPGDGFELTLQHATAHGGRPTAPVERRVEAWAALDDAVGGNWMDESLGLPPRLPDSRTESPPESPPEPQTSVADSDPPPPPAIPPAIPPPKRTSGPPPMPVFDPEITLDPIERPVVAAIAPDPGEPPQHEPPPHRPDAPAIGMLVLPDGDRVPIRGTVVLGRNPDMAAARVDGDAVLRRLDVGADVSRTHLVVRANGPTIEAIDCDSSGHTVLLSPGAVEPVLLEPWVPHELTVGDALYLGGPTQVRIAE